LHLAVLVFLALERVGIAREKLAFALCNVLAANEEKDAGSSLASLATSFLKAPFPSISPIEWRCALDAPSWKPVRRHWTAEPRLMADLLQKAMREGGKKKRGGRG
jgi:hypothetical protein